jgi:hypothetical protein
MSLGIDDRICMFYIAERIKDVVTSDNPREEAVELLTEMHHNIGVNTRMRIEYEQANNKENTDGSTNDDGCMECACAI